MKIPFIDIASGYHELQTEIDSAVRDVLASGHYILGPNVKALEQEFAGYHQVPYALGLASGTDALLLALRACGIGAGDEVIVPAFTFISTASTVVYAGARPAFADIDPHTYTMTEATIKKALTKKTKAIIVVHLYGQPAEMAPIMKLCREKKLALIEDVAQAIGSEYQGHKAGSMGVAGCYSFYPTKNLGAIGDGGMVITTKKTVYQNLLKLRDHGQAKKYQFEMLGYNSRLDEIQAAVLRIKMKKLEDWAKRRIQIADLYLDLLKDIPQIECPQVIPGTRHVYNLFTISAIKRDGLREYLSQQGIGTAIHYPAPLHLQKAFANLKYKRGDMPFSEAAAKKVISIPLYPQIPEEHIEYTARKIREFYSKK